MSKRFGFITWRSHPNEKYLDNDFWQLIQPMLSKSNRYLVALEDKGTPCSHYHIILEFAGDLTHLKQKFNSKPFKLFFKRIKDEKLETKLDSKFMDGCLNLKLVENTEEDLYKIIGYVCKDNLAHSKGFTDTDITVACKFYHTIERQKPKKIDASWKIPNIKTIHSFLEHYSKEWDIPIYSPLFKLQLADNSVSLAGVSKDTLIRVFNELIYKNHKDCPEFQYYKVMIMEQFDDENAGDYDNMKPQVLLSHIEELEAKLLQHGIDYVKFDYPQSY